MIGGRASANRTQSKDSLAILRMATPGLCPLERRAMIYRKDGLYSKTKQESNQEPKQEPNVALLAGDMSRL